jgi:hypothetical protein
MSTREPINARLVSICRNPISIIFSCFEELKETEAEVAARQDLRGGRAGSLRNARRLANRRLGTGPDPKRFERPPSIEVRKMRKALRRKLARAS